MTTKFTPIQHEVIEHISTNGVFNYWLVQYCKPELRRAVKNLEKRGIIKLYWSDSRQSYAYFFTDKGLQFDTHPEVQSTIG